MVKDFFYRRRIKPLIDWCMALILLFVLAPVLLFIVLVLSIVFSGKPFFTQLRVGENEKPFWILKFRSMKDLARNDEKDSERLDGIGRFMRKSSLDELPQLVNVMRGEMSLIGPRPLLIDYLPYYNEIEKKRHLVKPGITGLAQVNGRNKIGWAERLKFDVFYAEKSSFWIDLKIMIKTVAEIFRFGSVNFPDNKIETFIEYASKR